MKKITMLESTSLSDFKLHTRDLCLRALGTNSYKRRKRAQKRGK